MTENGVSAQQLSMEFLQLLPNPALTLIIVLGTLIGIWSFQAIRIVLGSRGLTEALGEFVAMIGQGRLEAAYASLTPAYKGRVPFKEFKRVLQRTGLRQYLRSRPGKPDLQGDRVVLPVTLSLRNGQSQDLTVTFLREGKGWKIDDFDVAVFDR
ncbi:hypothetical protein [Synechococcus elongatus]|uniref:hypothetical protein n=1 Tax=Synechococcus elongatus TaxID=32046 RepID=UPI000AD6C0C7|nr:hypothetical protein [Synechococcus elongatus]WKW04576.1 hypothetical protein QY054_08235 [Synechococcus elongatus PCC 7942 = FACHB-805]